MGFLGRHLITSSSTDPITTSLQEKADLFDVAAAKYAAKVAG